MLAENSSSQGEPSVDRNNAMVQQRQADQSSGLGAAGPATVQ